MGDQLTGLFEWLETLSPLYAYAVLLLVAYGENVLPPIPGDMAIVFAGYLVGVGRLNFAVVVLLATIGGVLGFMTMYAAGHRIGVAVLDPKRLRWLPKGKIIQAQQWLHRWGFGVVASNRFLSGLRSVISLTVGMAHMHVWKTTAYATLSAFLWTVLITFAGYKVGENWASVSGYLRAYGWGFLILMVLAAFVQLVYYLRKRRVLDDDAVQVDSPASPEAEESVAS